jgi:hypothetical protein
VPTSWINTKLKDKNKEKLSLSDVKEYNQKAYCYDELKKRIDTVLKF